MGKETSPSFTPKQQPNPAVKPKTSLDRRNNHNKCPLDGNEFKDVGDELDLVHIYLKEIGQFSLLSAKEEKSLGRQIFISKLALSNLEFIAPLLPQEQQNKIESITEQGRGKILLDALKNRILKTNPKKPSDQSFLTEIAKNDMMTDEKLRDGNVLKFYQEQVRLSNLGSCAFEKFFNSNLRLVIPIAKKHMYRGLSFLDLIQEGNEGLMKAIERFDTSLGFKFSTYATWWITQSITRAIADTSRTIRIPCYVEDTLALVRREQEKLIAEQGRQVSLSEAARNLGMNPKYKYMKETINVMEPLSLNTSTGKDRGVEFGDIIEDKKSKSPQDLAEDADTRALVMRLLSFLTEKEKRVLILRFGLENQTKTSLEKVGQDFDLSKERIRRIEARALRKLKTPRNEKIFRDLL